MVQPADSRLPSVENQTPERYVAENSILVTSNRKVKIIQPWLVISLSRERSPNVSWVSSTEEASQAIKSHGLAKY